MNINELSDKQKIISLTVVTIIIFIIIINLTIYPIFTKKSELNRKITNAKSLNTYLIKSKQELQKNKVFNKINTMQAKKIINKNFNNITNKVILIKQGDIVITIKDQSFSKIINNIYTLKNNYGIVVIKALFNKKKSGIVDANLTLRHP